MNQVRYLALLEVFKNLREVAASEDVSDVEFRKLFLNTHIDQVPDYYTKPKAILPTIPVLPPLSNERLYFDTPMRRKTDKLFDKSLLDSPVDKESQPLLIEKFINPLREAIGVIKPKFRKVDNSMFKEVVNRQQLIHRMATNDVTLEKLAALFPDEGMPSITVTDKVKDTYFDIACYLYKLLDDIASASDMAKTNDAFYRIMVENIQKSKNNVCAACDGYTLVLRTDAEFAAFTIDVALKHD